MGERRKLDWVFPPFLLLCGLSERAWLVCGYAMFFSTLCMRRTFVYLLNCSENNNNQKKKNQLIV